MSNTYRVGIVGCGGMGRRHAMTYAAIPQSSLIAVSDANEQYLGAFAERWGVDSTYVDYRGMLEKENLDLLSVTTWEDSHCEIVVAAAQSGIKGIMCEKPMAMTLAEADRMISACDEAGTKLAIDHMRRYRWTYQKAKELIDAGQLGEVHLMRAYCGGWQLTNWGTHYADMLNFLNGDQCIEWVVGQTSWKKGGMAFPNSQMLSSKRGDKYIAEDSAVGLMRYENGVRAILETGEHSRQDWEGGDSRCQLSVYGILGTLIVSDRHIEYCTKGSDQWVKRALTESEMQEQGRLQFERPFRELIECVETGREHELSGRRGRVTMEMMLGIYESSRSRIVVELPLKVRDNPFLAMIEAGDLP